MFGSNSRSGLNFRFRSKDRARLRRRRVDRRLQVAAEVLLLEERCMLSLPGNQIPPTQISNKNLNVDLDKIIWNGGDPLNPNGVKYVPSPSMDTQKGAPPGGAMKTITLTDNGPTMIYPFIRDSNTAMNGSQYYDPQDLHPAAGQSLDFREYVGYQTGTPGPAAPTFIGLPKGASIQFQVPLVFWAAATMYIATDPANQTSSIDVYNYNSSARISIAGKAPVGKGPQEATWVINTSNYPAGDTPVIIFYYSSLGKGVNDAAPAQLIEWNFRDPYLMTSKFIVGVPNETKVIMNYDVSYVNKLVAPLALEASGVPITVGNQLDTNNPITYYGYQDYGWNPSDKDVTSFDNLLTAFVNNKGKNKLLGNYFGGKGWPEYFQGSLPDIVIPSGGNIFAQSPLNNTRSPYAGVPPTPNNYYMLSSTSNGAGPLRFASIGATYAEKDTIHFADNYKSQLEALKGYLDDGKTMVLQRASLGDYPVGTEVKSVNPDELTITLKGSHDSRVDNGIYDFGSPQNDYAVTAITKLWYAWAKYYVDTAFEKYPDEMTVSATYKPPKDPGLAYNAFRLTRKPEMPLLVGMKVAGQNWIKPGTTILKITNSKGMPIPSANAAGDIIYLSLLPTKVPSGSQAYAYTFGKPLKTSVPFAGTVTDPYNLTFPAGDEKAKLFAGSVYAAMLAQAPVLLPKPPDSIMTKGELLVGQIIQFSGVLPDDKVDAGGKNLTGQVRDVVKSILRGVWNFEAVPNQKEWYPNPAEPMTGGQDFDVYNLDPYVWFVRSPQAEGTYGYSFSVDDDVSNPSAPGPVLDPNSTAGNPIYNHMPNNLQIAVGGIQGLGNDQAWFPTLRWGRLKTTATIEKVGGTGEYKNDYMVWFKGDLAPKEYMKLFEQIFPPGPGESGATVSAPGYLKPGTTVTFKGPNGLDKPQFVLSQPPLQTTGDNKPIDITITGPFET
jgi:hypothetical protein